eukprot:gene57327-biopygen103832
MGCFHDGTCLYALPPTLAEECFDTSITKGEFTDAPCLKQTISKLLGYAIVFGSGILKVPQIMKIPRAAVSAQTPGVSSASGNRRVPRFDALPVRPGGCAGRVRIVSAGSVAGLAPMAVYTSEPAF